MSAQIIYNHHPHQAKYLAHELTKRCASDSDTKVAAALVDAQLANALAQARSTFPSQS